MKIQKFLHSCLLFEKDGRRLLIDPGAFSFIEGKLKPSDIGRVDAILITHKHQDHFDPEILKQFLGFGPTQIVTIKEIGDVLAAESISYEAIVPGDEREIVGFTVRVFEAPHGPVLVEVVENIAYLIDGTVLHPGDSFDVRGLEHCETLALPIAGPWAKQVEALAMAERMRPKRVIPIHDVIIKDFSLAGMYNRFRIRFEKIGIEFYPLGLGDELSI